MCSPLTTEHLAASHPGSSGDHGAQRFVGRSQSVLVLDRHHAAPTHGAGEHHHTLARREDRLAGIGDEIHSAMPRAVRVLGSVKRGEHDRRWMQRPGVLRTRRRHPGTG